MSLGNIIKQFAYIIKWLQQYIKKKQLLQKTNFSKERGGELIELETYDM